MIDIEKIRGYYEIDKILFSNHALERIRQRGIKQRDIKKLYYVRRDNRTVS